MQSGWKGKGEKENLLSTLIKLILIKKSSLENLGLQWFEKEISCKGLILIRPKAPNSPTQWN